MGPSGRTRSKRNPKNNEPTLIPKGIAAPSRPVRRVFIQPEPKQKKYLKIPSQKNTDEDYQPIGKILFRPRGQNTSRWKYRLPHTKNYSNFWGIRRLSMLGFFFSLFFYWQKLKNLVTFCKKKKKNVKKTLKSDYIFQFLQKKVKKKVWGGEIDFPKTILGREK